MAVISVLSFSGAAKAAGKPLLLVLVGQSNMAGFGTTGSDVPSNLQSAQSNVFYWRDTVSSGAPSYGFQTYQAGANSDPSSRTGPDKWGPEAEFAREWRIDNPTQALYMAKSSVAGSQLEDTSIEQAPGVPTSDWSPSTHELFDTAKNFIADAKTGMADLGVNDYDTVVLWMQGESDAADSITAADYFNNLTNFITQVRAQWNVGSSVQFIEGRIASTGWSYAAPVRMAEERVAANDSSLTKMVSTDGFPLAADNKHYTATGQVDLGQAMYQAYVGTYATSTVNMDPTATFTSPEGPGTGVVIGTVAATNSPSPTASYEFVSGGQTSGLTIGADTGVITVTDGSQLAYSGGATRAFTVRGSNGINSTTTVVTLNLTSTAAATDVSNTVFKGDPSDSGHYVLSAGLYQTLTDVEGSTTVTITQASAGRRPSQSLYSGGGGKYSTLFSTSTTPDSMAAPVSTGLVNDSDTDFTIAADVRPDSNSLINTANFAGLYTSAANTRLALYYNYTNQKFGVISILNSNGATTNASSTNTFPPNANYRVEARKQGTTVSLYVNDVQQPLTFTGAIRSTIMASGESGGLVIGGSGASGGLFSGNIGLFRFIKGSPSQAELTFLSKELQNWSAGYSLAGPSSGTSGQASTNFTVTIATTTFSGSQTIILSDGGNGGTFTPSVGSGGVSPVTVTPTNGATSFTFTYTPASPGTKTLTFTNGQSWDDAYPLTYTANAPDTTAPSVSLDSPILNTQISGHYTLTMSATDNVALSSLQFKVDNANVGSAGSASPYTFSWDSTSVSDGTHSIAAVAKDTSGNISTSSTSIVVDNIAPTITGISASSITSSGATISWNTNEAADSQVAYGLSNVYTASSTYDGTLVTLHSNVLTGLDAGTTYHYRAASADAAGNKKFSGDLTFTTSAAPVQQQTTNTSTGNQYGFVPGGFASTPSSIVAVNVPGCPPGYSCQPINIIAPSVSYNVSLLTTSLDLEKGATSQTVNSLQKYLNANGFAVSSFGAGSIGHETSYFGPATQAALAKFQKAHGISPAVGYFGPITRAFIASVKP